MGGSCNGIGVMIINVAAHDRWMKAWDHWWEVIGGGIHGSRGMADEWKQRVM